MITGGRDGRIIMWNTKDNFKVMNVIDIGIKEQESEEIKEEINALVYINIKQENVNHPFIVIGTQTGKLFVYDISKNKIIFTEVN